MLPSQNPASSDVLPVTGSYFSIGNGVPAGPSALRRGFLSGWDERHGRAFRERYDDSQEQSTSPSFGNGCDELQALPRLIRQATVNAEDACSADSARRPRALAWPMTPYHPPIHLGRRGHARRASDGYLVLSGSCVLTRFAVDRVFLLDVFEPHDQQRAASAAMHFH